mmetsp:Transcript_86192/g.230188  ORF Transcript_86192/g.230188 Transcript_86192/m.230188 type:complete len:82 (-) Transcript_86192:1038-1283(-)
MHVATEDTSCSPTHHEEQNRCTRSLGEKGVLFAAEPPFNTSCIPTHLDYCVQDPGGEGLAEGRGREICLRGQNNYPARRDR